MRVKELANVTGQAILDNLLDRRGIKQALQEIDTDVMDELRQTIGEIALAAVIPAIQAEALERAAVTAEAFPLRTHGGLATTPHAAAEQAADEIAAAIRAMKEPTP
jgi:hypothetical protein